jgi:hypothetical protein
MEDGERAGLAAALRARLAAAGLELPADDAGRMERDLGLHLERLAVLAAAADLGPADPPLTSLPPLPPPGEARTAPPAGVPGSRPAAASAGAEPRRVRPVPSEPPAAAPAPSAPGPRAGEPAGLVEAARLVREGTASSAELVEAALARIEALDGRLGAFVTLLARESRSEAAAGDAQQRRGEALGTDAAGSVRIPAACCGVVGFKPSLGRVPVAGVWPLSCWRVPLRDQH